MSYSGDPTSSSLDAVRFLCHDTDPAAQLLGDDEIAYWSFRCDSVFADDLMTAAFCCDSIAGKYASEVSITADGVSISGEQLQTKWNTLAATLRAQYKLLNATGAPLVGGVDWMSPIEPGVRPTNFGIGMDDNMRGGSTSYGYRGNTPDWTDSGDIDGDWH